MQLIIDPEFKSLIPALSEKEYSGLTDSIRAEGCRDPIVIWHNIILDGHNRFEICSKYNIPYETVQRDFQTRDDAKLWMIGNQLSRRNINNYARTTLEALSNEIMAKKAAAKVRQSEAGGDRKSEGYKKTAFCEFAKSGSQNESKRHNGVFCKQPESSADATLKINPPSSFESQKANSQLPVQPINTTMDVAKRAGVGTNTVSRVMTINKKIDEAIANRTTVAGQKPEKLKKQLMDGDVSINEAYTTIKRAEKEAKREEKRQDNAAKVETLATPLDAVGLFQTIVIDPPWDWGDEGDVNQLGRAKPDYHTMPIDEIMKLPIAKIADDNCHLYVWVTNRSLPKAFKLIEAWGFRYITCLTWVKPSYGMGNYFRGSTEQVLFCIKGSQPIKRHDVGTHFEAPRGDKHSSKPEEFYKIVESCSYAPYIDIFGRKGREGWSVWGENG